MMKTFHLKKDTKQRPSLGLASQPCNIPPLFIVNTIRDYQAVNKDEISVDKGDFLHVIDDTMKKDYYQVCNPLTNKVGLAPARVFQIFDKKARVGQSDNKSNESSSDSTRRTFDSIGSKPGIDLSQPSSGNPYLRKAISLGRNGSSVSAVALYRFQSERPDELELEKGTKLIVVAKSTQDWLVARTETGNQFGLVPTAYLQLLDNPNNKPNSSIIDKLPTVSEWKQMLKEPSDSSISKDSNHHFSLDSDITITQEPESDIKDDFKGNSDKPGSKLSVDKIKKLHQSEEESSCNTPIGSSCYSSSYELTDSSEPNSPASPINAISFSNFKGSPTNPKSSSNLPTTLHVTQFFKKESQYIYTIELKFTNDNLQHTLYRTYDDFYVLHTNLMTKFPIEAGKTGESRIIPFMPGSVPRVDERIASLRKTDLDLYIQQLYKLPQSITGSSVFGSFFKLRSDDLESPLTTTTKNPTLTRTKSDKKPIKVKVVFNEEIIVFRLPQNASNFDLQQKICDRFGDNITTLQYKDTEGQLCDLDLTTPLQHITRTPSGKLLIYAS